ncbi:MAG: tRNA epoxyqueuosine(34) reductase QueG [Gaiellaceae bacterium]
MDAASLRKIARELGLDAIGAAPAEPYRRAERAIAERGERGLFAELRFTMSRPQLSCHPERLLEGARSVVSAAFAYSASGADPGAGEGRLARHARRDHYAELRLRLEALGSRLGGAHRVFVDSSEHVDREAAVRAGIGFFGKNTLVIAPRLGSWIVLGTLVSELEIEATAPLERDCGSCRLCLEACPTAALVEPGVLDARRCLSYWTQARATIPERFRTALGATVYGCDICQEVCPWNRGAEKRQTEPIPADSEPLVSLDFWLTASDEELLARYQRLYVPRRDARYLRRNAIVALASTGTSEHERLLDSYAGSEDGLLAEHARWALRSLRVRLERERALL